MSVERKNQLWVPLTEVKRALSRSKLLNKAQVSGLLDKLDQLTEIKGFPWNKFLKGLEDATKDVYSPFFITKTKSLKQRATEIQYKVGNLVDFYLNPNIDAYEDVAVDITVPYKIASIVNITIESILGRGFLDLDTLQKSALLDDLEKYGFYLLSSDLIKSPTHSAEKT